MDPTATELENIQDLAGARAWAGVDGPLWAAFDDVLGKPARVREIVLIDRPTWDAAVATTKLPPVAPATDEKALTPAEKARLESFRRVCILRTGGIPDTPGAPGVAAPTAATQAPGGSPALSARKLKLSAILDPTLDAEVVPMEQTEIAAAYDAYRVKFGDFPTNDSDISPDQLSALQQVIKAGAIPFTDFSIFGPYGQRLLRKQTFTSWQLSTATGEWQRREQPGPPDYHRWFESWKVFRTGMLLLEAADAERLDAYAEHIRGFVTQFTEEAWWIIAKADHHLRSEHLDRLRRELRNVAQFGFTERKPWSACFAKAVKDSEFWHKELITPATLFLARVKKTETPSASHQTPHAQPAREANKQPAKKARAQRRYTGEDKSVRNDEGIYTHNRRGIEICRLYGQGKCGSKAAQGKCRNNRSHQCDRCLGPHMSMECTGKSS